MYVCTHACTYNDTHLEHTLIVCAVRTYNMCVHKYINCIILLLHSYAFLKLATHPKVTVQAIINVDVDFKEIFEDRANRLSAITKGRQYTTTEELITIDQEFYLQSTGRRLYIVDSISTEMYERLRSINTIHSRTMNYSRENVFREMRKVVKPFGDQLYYDEIHSNKTNGSANGESQWLARLLMQQSTMQYIPLDVPVTGVLATYKYLLNCKYLSPKCAGYVTQ